MIARYILGLAVMLQTITIIGMDKPQVEDRMRIRLESDFIRFISNNAVFVKNLVAKEQRSFCPQMELVEHVLINKLRVSESKFPHDILAQHQCDKNTVNFLRSIADRTSFCIDLAREINAHNIEKVKQTVRDNRYTVNNYRFYMYHNDYSIKSGFRMTPLHYVLEKSRQDQAFRSVSSDYLSVLLHAGANPNAINGNGDSPMHLACIVEHVELLWQFGAKNNIKGDCGCTPLMEHIERGNCDIAKHLIHAGAKVKTQAKSGSTALGVAITKQYADLVSLLLDQGASFSIMDMFGITPAGRAADIPEMKKIIEPYMRKCLLRDLVQNYSEPLTSLVTQYPWMDFMLHSDTGDISILSWAKKNCLSKDSQLLDSVHTFQKCLNYALLQAEDSTEVERLIAAGARVNTGNKNKAKTLPLLDAVRQKNTEKALLLLKHGALVDRSVLTSECLNLQLWQTLHQEYDLQWCTICKEHPEDMEDIPCKNEHENSFICQQCYKQCTKANNQCPYGCGDLGEYDKAGYTHYY